MKFHLASKISGAPSTSRKLFKSDGRGCVGAVVGGGIGKGWSRTI